MKIFLTGITGSVGNLVAAELLQRDVQVRALARDPQKVTLPVEVVQGDLADARSFADQLQGMDALFLLLTYDGDPDIIRAAVDAGVQKVVAIHDGTDYPIEAALRKSGIPTTILRPVGFMKNVINYWQDSIRTDGTALTPFPDAEGAHIHEADIADVAVTVLLESGHEGQDYWLTGPEVVTPREEIIAISQAIGKPVEMLLQTEEEAREQYASWGFPPDMIDYAIEAYKNPKPFMYTVTPTVTELTGKPGRTFAQWAQENKEKFL